MSNTPHELHSDFPGAAEAIHRLKLTDPHFVKLIEEYTRINREVHRAETRQEPVSPEHESALRRTRLRLKDQISGYLKVA